MVSASGTAKARDQRNAPFPASGNWAGPSRSRIQGEVDFGFWVERMLTGCFVMGTVPSCRRKRAVTRGWRAPFRLFRAFPQHVWEPRVPTEKKGFRLSRCPPATDMVWAELHDFGDGGGGFGGVHKRAALGDGSELEECVHEQQASSRDAGAGWRTKRTPAAERDLEDRLLDAEGERGRSFRVSPRGRRPRRFSVAPLGPARIVWSGVFAPRTKGWKPPEEKDGDVAAFARTRVNPGVATSPHSGECGYTRTGWKPVADSASPLSGQKNSATSKLTLRLSMLTDSAAVVIGEKSRFFRAVNRFLARLQLADHEALEQASGEILDTALLERVQICGK